MHLCHVNICQLHPVKVGECRLHVAVPEGGSRAKSEVLKHGNGSQRNQDLRIQIDHKDTGELRIVWVIQ